MQHQFARRANALCSLPASFPPDDHGWTGFSSSVTRGRLSTEEIKTIDREGLAEQKLHPYYLIEQHHHSAAAGRKSETNFCGVRENLLFRKAKLVNHPERTRQAVSFCQFFQCFDSESRLAGLLGKFSLIPLL